MSIRNILVVLDIMSLRTSALSCAVGLAERLDASVSAFVAGQPWAASSMGLDATGEALVRQQRVELEEALGRAEEQFRVVVPTPRQGRFRGLVEAPTTALIEEAVTTDLIMVQPDGQDRANASIQADIGDVILGAGRPVIVLGGEASLPLRHALVAWKDTREARHAIADALPLLQLAEQVGVVEVDEGDYSREREEVDTILEWFKLHKVRATSEVLPLKGTVTETIAARASETKCDLVVSGAYGHARLREWMFGGVTTDLLGSFPFNRFLSN